MAALALFISFMHTKSISSAVNAHPPILTFTLKSGAVRSSPPPSSRSIHRSAQSPLTSYFSIIISFFISSDSNHFLQIHSLNLSLFSPYGTAIASVCSIKMSLISLNMRCKAHLWQTQLLQFVPQLFASNSYRTAPRTILSIKLVQISIVSHWSFHP